MGRTGREENGEGNKGNMYCMRRNLVKIFFFLFVGGYYYVRIGSAFFVRYEGYCRYYYGF